MSPRQIVGRGILFGLLAAVCSLAAFVAYVDWYTGTDRILPGVTVGRVPVGGLTVREAKARLGAPQPAPQPTRRPEVQAGSAVGGLPPDGPTLWLRWEGRAWPISLRNVGAVPDAAAAARSAGAIGRKGGLVRRTMAFAAGVIHGHYVPLESRWDEAALAVELERVAGEVNRPAADARLDVEAETVVDEAPGAELDLAATATAVRQAVLAGRPEAAVVVRQVPPVVTRKDLAQARQYPIVRFTTPILAADPGRVQNISMAVRKISGVVLRPGQLFSFNDIVGPRDAANGWAQAKELYQGEFVLGYGGGICQVSSTLYNAVLLAGLEVKERYHHDRPLQYVDPGRDATVAWKVLDFRFRNNLDVPVILGARVLAGTPQQIELVMYSPRQKLPAQVRLETADVKYSPPDMEEIPDPAIPNGRRKVLDEGQYGIEVKTYRVFRDANGERREPVSHDKYLPKAGKVRVGTGPGEEGPDTDEDQSEND